MNAHDSSLEKRNARLFRNGRSQAVRIPKEFEMKGNEVQITKIADGKLVLEARPVVKISPMLAWLAANGPIDDFPRDPGEEGMLPLDEVNI